jgi:hypothetical protein
MQKGPYESSRMKVEDEAHRQFEASTSRVDAATPDASSQTMDVESEIEPMECDEKQADETFENRDLAFIIHWRTASVV